MKSLTSDLSLIVQVMKKLDLLEVHQHICLHVCLHVKLFVYMFVHMLTCLFTFFCLHDCCLFVYMIVDFLFT